MNIICGLIVTAIFVFVVVPFVLFGMDIHTDNYL